MRNDFEKIITDYSAEYCLFLEASYGKGMMSEGGSQAIERMFATQDLQHKKILDIGFGLGGVAFYLAETYSCEVSGVEINPWLVAEATRRIPKHLQGQVQFFLYSADNKLPFPDSHFDLVYSKGVLTHIKDKLDLLQEVFRVLKLGGVFLIDDWLSNNDQSFGARIDQMCQTEGLTIFPMTEASYRAVLGAANFSAIEIRNENQNYHQYNLEVVNHFKQQLMQAKDKRQAIAQAIHCYQLIADAIQANELLIRWISARKL